MKNTDNEISYDAYNILAERMEQVKIKDFNDWIPTKKDIEKMVSIGLIDCLGIVSWITERYYENLMPEEKDRIKLLNHLVIKLVHFTEHNQDSAEKKVITRKKYKEILRFVRTSRLNKLETIPDIESLKEWFSSVEKYCLVFILWFLEYAKDNGLNEHRDYLLSTFHEHFEIISEIEPIIVTLNELDSLCKIYEQFIHEQENWWPTLEEIDEVIEPNFSVSYDFALWLLVSGPDPITKEQAKSKSVLRELLMEYLIFKEPVTDSEANMIEEEESICSLYMLKNLIWQR